MKILGIDEAGRGCVVGPMVVAGVAATNLRIKEFGNLGIRDSKRLTAKRRRELAGEIEKRVLDFKLVLHQPEAIDLTSLNELDLRTIAELINQLQPEKAIFDVPTHPGGVKNFINSVRLRLSREVDLAGENKADEKYPVVSAASILAKVRRDEIIEELKKEFGDFGSGYMSDPKTQDFLKVCYEKNGGFPHIVRHKWSSVQKFLVEQQKFINISERKPCT